ncbi:ComF family protein [Terrabacter lapilli]|uniref:ComF family protein n=1 Tax=Terrabacter lapilli TaxID=436231 RepID=A0ABN2RDS0_9MICO
MVRHAIRNGNGSRDDDGSTRANGSRRAGCTGLLSRLRASDLADLVLPRECGGCLRAGVDWCPRCARALRRLAFVLPGAGSVAAPTADLARTPGRGERTAPGGGGPWVVPHPAPEGMPPVYAWGIYADPLRAAVSAWKDAGRRDLVPVLLPLLREALDGALWGAGWPEGVALVVPAPSSRRAVRQRGDTPMVGLCEAAVTALGGPRRPGGRGGPVLRVAPALRHVRRVEDQSGLGTAERRGNLARALEVDPRWGEVVRGRRCVLVDDVVTTGATLAEAARALRSAGALGVVGAAMAATQRTRG